MGGGGGEGAAVTIGSTFQLGVGDGGTVTTGSTFTKTHIIQHC